MSNGKSEFIARAARLPGQLLLALVNATALLVIVACILVIVVLNRMDAAAANLAGAVSDAVFARLQVSPQDFRARLVSIDGRLDRITAELEKRELPEGALVLQVAALNENLAALQRSAGAIASAGPDIAEAALEQAGEAVTGSLLALRSCQAREPDPVERGHMDLHKGGNNRE